ncbi:MAG: hypothetical protein HQK63_13490 [Desulfamplus sp.]|nr:hypothetical protein [Desulfamplus sp.]
MPYIEYSFKSFIFFMFFTCFVQPALSFVNPHIQNSIPDDGKTMDCTTIFGEKLGCSRPSVSSTRLDTSVKKLGVEASTPNQTISFFQQLDDLISHTAASSRGGEEVNFQEIADSIMSVEEIVVEANSQGATSKDMNSISGHINNILYNISDIMKISFIVNERVETDDVVTLLNPLKGLAGAAIIAAVEGEADTTQTVYYLGDIVTDSLQGAEDAGIVSNTGRIIGSAGGIVNNTIERLPTDAEFQTIVKSTLDDLQVALNQIIGQTTENIKDKAVNNSYVSKAGGSLTDRADDSFDRDDFKSLMIKVSDLTTSMIKRKAVLNNELSGTMQNLSLETIKNILPAFIPKNMSGLRNSKSDIEKLLTDYPQLLNEVINIASVNLTSGMLITKENISELIKDKTSLTAEEKTILINGLPALPVFDQDIIQSGDMPLSLVDLLSKALENPQYQLSGSTVEVISSKGLSLMVLLRNESKGIEIPLYIQDARVVSTIIPSGLHVLPEGTVILVSNGIAGIITPAPLDAVDTLLSADALLKIENLFGSDKKEISDLNVSNSGNFNITFKDGTKFSGAFGYGTSKEGDGEFDAGTSSFELQMTDPASEAYSVLVTYSNGTTQTLSPSIAAIEQLVKVLDTLAAGSYTLDKTTGIFTVMGMRFKPSYLIEPIATSEQTWFKANRDSNSIAWETKDYNGDGAVDLKMWTSGIVGIAEGKQIIYTVLK